MNTPEKKKVSFWQNLKNQVPTKRELYLIVFVQTLIIVGFTLFTYTNWKVISFAMLNPEKVNTMQAFADDTFKKTFEVKPEGSK